MTSPSDPRSPADRLADLERRLALMDRQVDAIREEVQQLRRGMTMDAAAPAIELRAPEFEPTVARPRIDPALDPLAAALTARLPAAAPPPPPRRSQPPWAGLDAERLIGRYGTLALATLTILLGVGAFLGWAIANGRLGPSARVTLGALAAAIVAGLGFRLRARGAKRFGDTLLALALAVIHVDAWGAGPALHLVPNASALAVAALASAALAALALRDGSEALFVVGVGGAVLAPFVVSETGARPTTIAIYGFLVLAAGMAAIKGRRWPRAALVIAGGALLFTIATIQARSGTDPRVVRAVPELFALAVGAAALGLLGATYGGRLAQLAASLALSAIIARGELGQTAVAPDQIAGALVATVLALAAVRAAGTTTRDALGGALLVPLAALGVAASAANAYSRDAAGGIAIVWGLVLAASTVGAPVAAAGLQALAASVAGSIAISLFARRAPVVRAAGLAVWSVAIGAALKRTGWVPLRFGALATLVIATLLAWVELSARTAYVYAPFLTGASAGALVVVLCWGALVGTIGLQRIEEGTRVNATIAAVIAAFLWAHEEVARAVSVDVATFLLVLLYAVAGILAIGIGRQLGARAARQVGLALAVYAAVKAVIQASGLAIGWRVGSYLLAGSFLLGVAYWYRGREGDQVPATTERAS